MLAAALWPSATAETTSGPRTMSPAAQSQSTEVRRLVVDLQTPAVPVEFLGQGLAE